MRKYLMECFMGFVSVLVLTCYCGCVDVVPQSPTPSVVSSGGGVYDGFITSHEHFYARVVKISDGDTIWVMVENGTKYKIRLLGVDTPEIYHENSPYKFYINNDHPINNISYLKVWGYRARDYAKNKLENKIVVIVFDNIAPKKGYYGRYLGYVYYDNGSGYRNFNEELLLNGYARVYSYKKYNKWVIPNFELKGEFIKDAEYAKEHKIGVWSYHN